MIDILGGGGGGGGGRIFPLCLPNLLIQPFNQTPHRNLLNLNLHVWLLEPQLSRNRASLRQWQHELRLLKEDQPSPPGPLPGAAPVDKGYL